MKFGVLIPGRLNFMGKVYKVRVQATRWNAVVFNSLISLGRKKLGTNLEEGWTNFQPFAFKVRQSDFFTAG